MLILSLTYIVPLEQVDVHSQAHMEWVQEGYDRGWFLASGRKNPRTGGVILAKGDRAELEAFCATDPFAQHAVATYEITEMVVSRAVTGVEGLL